MHVRRGDYVNTNFIPLAETDYYIRALSMLNAKTNTQISNILIVSDDIEWCKSNLVSKNAMLIYPDYDSEHRVLDDWLILKACNNHIVANSTFSWWAAWLNQNDEQVVICPKQMGYKLDKWICI